MIIYQILFPNGKSYIGKTIDPTPARRILEHKKSKYAVGNAIRKYGFENIIVNILQDNISDVEMLNTLEKYYISSIRSLKTENGYNIRRGGDGGDIFSTMTDEERKITTQKMRESRNKFLATLTDDEKQEKYAKFGDKNGMYGKTHTPETLQLLKEISSNYTLTDEQKQKHIDVKKKHRGENSWNTKYSKEQWLDIYKEVKSYSITQKKLAEKYGVSVRTIEELSAGRHWCFRKD